MRVKLDLTRLVKVKRDLTRPVNVISYLIYILILSESNIVYTYPSTRTRLYIYVYIFISTIISKSKFYMNTINIQRPVKNEPYI